MAVKVIVRVAPIDIWEELRPSAAMVEAAELLVHLLKPASLAAFLLSAWRFGADLGWTNTFLFQDGIASHWQIWAAIGAAMMVTERRFLR